MVDSTNLRAQDARCKNNSIRSSSTTISEMSRKLGEHSEALVYLSVALRLGKQRQPLDCFYQRSTTCLSEV